MGQDNEFELVHIESTVGHPERGAWVLAEDGTLSIIMESDTKMGYGSAEGYCLRYMKEDQEQSFAVFHYRRQEEDPAEGLRKTGHMYSIW